jgi:CheY-like chemotaxis protein
VAGTRLDLSALRLLVVDDQRASAELLQAVGLGLGFGSVVLEPSAEAAEQRVTAEPFALILVDFDLPVRSGAAFVEAMRRRRTGLNLTTPTVIASVHTPMAMLLRGRDVGADFVLRKPVDARALLNRLVWLATNDRRFVRAPTYCGPDRRTSPTAAAPEAERREAAADAAFTPANPFCDAIGQKGAAPETLLAAVGAKIEAIAPSVVADLDRAASEVAQLSGRGLQSCDAGKVLRRAALAVAETAGAVGYGTMGEVGRGLSSVLAGMTEGPWRPDAAQVHVDALRLVWARQHPDAADAHLLARLRAVRMAVGLED